MDIEFSLQKAADESPEATGDYGCKNHDYDEYRLWHGGRKVVPQNGTHNSSHKHLSGASDIEETCLVGKGEGKSHQYELGRHCQSISDSSLVGEGSKHKPFKSLDRILSNDKNKD